MEQRWCFTKSGMDIFSAGLLVKRYPGDGACPLMKRWVPVVFLPRLNMTRGLTPVASAICAHAPLALVITMTNPLSVGTSLLNTWDLEAVGLCELPETTARSAY